MDESVDADVSTRSVAVTSNFAGTKIIIFGAVNARGQDKPASEIYDIIIVVEGTPTPVMARKKSRIAGIWINTEGVRFDDVPSYYTISSTRPISLIAKSQVLKENAIGYRHIAMPAATSGLTAKQLDEFRRAVVRLKRKENLFQKDDNGVEFRGESLFRTSIDLPANVPVGPLKARVFLLRDGDVVSSFESEVILQREGLQGLLHDFAFDYPLFYGLFAVFLAASAGLIASTLFNRGAR